MYLYKILFSIYLDFLEPTDNDANTNEKGSFKKDDQEQKTNSDESYFTDWKYSSGKQNKPTKTI